MGNRLSRITTRTGDDGSTGLGDGRRVAKDCPRVALLGEVDELNSHLGVLLCEALSDSVHAQLVAIQHDLFDLGGEVADVLRVDCLRLVLESPETGGSLGTRHGSSTLIMERE